MTASISIPTNTVCVEGGGPFLYTFSACIICRLFDNDHCDQSEMIAHCNFNFYLIIINVEHLFMCLLDICMSSLGKRKKGKQKLLESKYLVLTCITHGYTAVLSIVGTRNLTEIIIRYSVGPYSYLNHI